MDSSKAAFAVGLFSFRQTDSAVGNQTGHLSRIAAQCLTYYTMAAGGQVLERGNPNQGQLVLYGQEPVLAVSITVATVANGA